MTGIAVKKRWTYRKNNDTAMMQKLGIEASKLAGDVLASNQISADDAVNLQLLMSQLDVVAQTVQAQNGEILAPELPEIGAVSEAGIDIATVENTLSSALSTLENFGVDTTAANSAYFDYLTASAGTKTDAFISAVNAINTTVDTAIAQQQAIGADTTALTALKAQLESALSGAGQGQTVARVQQTITQAETLVSALQSLPSNIKDSIGYDSAFNALLSAQMNGGNVELAQAALDKALAGIEAALESPSLDAGMKAELEGLLGEIDSKGVKVDNKIKKKGIVILDDGFFQIIDWNGYPEGARPYGPFIIIEGEEYNVARKLANNVNAGLHKQNSNYGGMQIHEIHPIKFGGSPTDLDNKIILTPQEHMAYTVFWNMILKNLKG